MAQGDMFLKLDGVKGESPDDKHKDEIQITSYGIGAANSGSGGVGSGSGISKVNVHDIHFTKLVDNSSPNLFILCCSGKHIDSAVFTIRKAGENPQEYLVITLNEVLVSSYNQSGHDGGGLPTESVTFNFSKIKIEYKIQNKDGTLGAANPKTYDIKANKAA
jgi:type VI secretion system secreted protein Hcp